MSKFIEINNCLINMDSISFCKYDKDEKSLYDDTLYIILQDKTTIQLSTNRFKDDAYEYHKNNKEGYEKIKEYLLNKE